jgi:hypothetical protein
MGTDLSSGFLYRVDDDDDIRCWEVRSKKVVEETKVHRLFFSHGSSCSSPSGVDVIETGSIIFISERRSVSIKILLLPNNNNGGGWIRSLSSNIPRLPIIIFLSSLLDPSSQGFECDVTNEGDSWHDDEDDDDDDNNGGEGFNWFQFKLSFGLLFFFNQCCSNDDGDNNDEEESVGMIGFTLSIGRDLGDIVPFFFLIPSLHSEDIGGFGNVVNKIWSRCCFCCCSWIASRKAWDVFSRAK